MRPSLVRARRSATDHHPRSHFASWNDAEGLAPGSPEYYSKQYYTRGTKCWNGPMRSVQVSGAVSLRVRPCALTGGPRSLCGRAARRTPSRRFRSLRNASTSSQERRRLSACPQAVLRTAGKTSFDLLEHPAYPVYWNHNIKLYVFDGVAPRTSLFWKRKNITKKNEGMILHMVANNGSPPYRRMTERKAINTKFITMCTYKTDRNEYRYQRRNCFESF